MSLQLIHIDNPNMKKILQCETTPAIMLVFHFDWLSLDGHVQDSSDTGLGLSTCKSTKLTSNRRPEKRSDPLKQQDESKSVCQLAKAQKIHQDYRGKAHVSSNCESVSSSVYTESVEIIAEGTQYSTCWQIWSLLLPMVYEELPFHVINSVTLYFYFSIAFYIRTIKPFICFY